MQVSNQVGTARWSTVIPNQPTVAGVQSYLQGYVVDPGSNALGRGVSNGGDSRAGMR